MFYAINVKKEIDNLSYDVDFKSLDLSSFSLNDLGTGNGRIKLKLQLIIINSGNYPLSFKNLNIKINYNNNLIAESSQNESSNLNKIILKSNSTNYIDHYFDIYINQSLFDLIGKLKNKQSTSINYDVSVTWLIFPIKTSQTLTT